MEAEGQVTEKGGTRMRKANTGIDQGEARPHLYWVQNTRGMHKAFEKIIAEGWYEMA